MLPNGGGIMTNKDIFEDSFPQDKQIGGNHYKDFHIQPYEFISKNDLSFFQGNVIKYVCRYKNKAGIQDYVSQEMGFENPYIISGQTYTRKQDSLVTDSLAGLASSIHKFGSDLRLLAHLKEVEEPFEKNKLVLQQCPTNAIPCALNVFVLSREFLYLYQKTQIYPLSTMARTYTR